MVIQQATPYTLPARAQGEQQNGNALQVYPNSADVVNWSQAHPEGDTLPELFRKSVAANPNGNYLGRKVDGEFKYLSYQQAQDKVHDFASGLVQLGFKPGERVALMSANRPEWVIADMGVMHAAGINAPLYFKDADETIAYQLKDTRASIAVVDSDETLKKVLAAEAELPNLKHIVVMEPTKLTSTKNLIQWSDFMQAGHDNLAKNQPEVERRIEGLKGTDIASMVYTSGSTGIGKGVMLHHANWVSNTEGVIELAGAAGALKPQDVELSFLPLSHIFERSIYYAVTAANAAIAYADSPKTIAGDMKLAKPSLMPCVPIFLDKIADGIQSKAEKKGKLEKFVYHWALGVGREVFEAKTKGEEPGWWLGLKHKAAHALVFSTIKEQMGGNMKLFISGGAPLKKETAEFLGALGIPVSEGYGASEVLVLTGNPPHHPKPGTVGTQLKGVELRLSPGESEIQARGPSVMNGYLGKEEKTRESFTEDGWYKTGDVGKVDSDGYLSIIGRLKDQDVLSTGKKVQTGPIEQLLKTNDFIDQAVLCGHNRAVEGAVIAPKFPALEKWAASQGIPTGDHAALVADERVQKHMKAEVKKTCENLSDYEQVKVVILSPEEFTETNGLTTTGGLKVKRPAVLQKFEAEINAAYDRGK